MTMRMFEKEEVAPYAGVLVNSTVFSLYRELKYLKTVVLHMVKKSSPPTKGSKRPLME